MWSYMYVNNDCITKEWLELRKKSTEPSAQEILTNNMSSCFLNSNTIKNLEHDEGCYCSPCLLHTGLMYSRSSSISPVDREVCLNITYERWNETDALHQFNLKFRSFFYFPQSSRQRWKSNKVHTAYSLWTDHLFISQCVDLGIRHGVNYYFSIEFIIFVMQCFFPAKNHGVHCNW